MVNYKCNRCGYEIKHRPSFKNHLYRKNSCNPTLDTIPVDEIKILYGFLESDPKKPQIDPQNFESDPKMTQIDPQNSHSINTKLFTTKSEKKTYICEYCNKSLSKSCHLNRHYTRCKFKINKNNEVEKLKSEKDEMKDTIETLLIELHDAKTTIKNITNNTNNTNNNNTINNNNTTDSHNNTINVHINNFGNENIEHLNKDYLTYLIKGAFGAIPKLIETVHFDPNHPENHNVKITNKKLPYAHVMKDNKWEIRDKNKVLEDIVDDKYNILDEHCDDNIKTNLNDFSQEVVDNFKDKYENCDKELLKDLKKKSEIVILNNSKC